MSTMSNNEISIRTTNWNNMNFYRRTVRSESLAACLTRCKHQDKVRIVQKALKKFPILDSQRAVVVSSRRWGKSTLHALYTRYISLKELELALISKDKQRIKTIIDKRINTRGQNEHRK